MAYTYRALLNTIQYPQRVRDLSRSDGKATDNGATPSPVTSTAATPTPVACTAAEPKEQSVPISVAPISKRRPKGTHVVKEDEEGSMPELEGATPEQKELVQEREED